MKVSSIIWFCVIIGWFIAMVYQVPTALEIEEKAYNERMAKFEWQMEVRGK